MDIIYQNPYRVIGILAAATEREIQRQKTKIEAYSKVGKEIKSDFDFDLDESVVRDEVAVAKAFSSLEQSQDKVNHALFWFLNYNSVDDIAIEHLKNSDPAKAESIWDRVTKNREISVSNFSAYNNISTLYFISPTLEKIKLGIELKIKLINSEFFKNFSVTVADQTFILDQNKQQEIFINIILSHLRAELLEDYDILDFFSNCPSEVKNYVSKKLTQKTINEIDSLIEETIVERKALPNLACIDGEILYEDSKEKLAELKRILGKDDFNYKMLADRVAKEIMQCADDYFSEQDDNYNKELCEKMITLLRQANELAVSSQLIDKIKIKINQVNQLLAEGPMLAAIEEMKSSMSIIESEYISLDEISKEIISVRVKLAIIKNNPSIDNDVYSKVSSGVVMRILNILIEVVNDSQVGLEGNPDKISEFKKIIPKAFNIMKSLDLFFMSKDTREWFDKNFSTIKSLNETSISISAKKETSGLGLGTIIFWIIVVIVIINMFN